MSSDGRHMHKEYRLAIAGKNRRAIGKRAVIGEAHLRVMVRRMLLVVKGTRSLPAARPAVVRQKRGQRGRHTGPAAGPRLHPQRQGLAGVLQRPHGEGLEYVAWRMQEGTKGSDG